jgi:basic amino acid/polyamine antiporter, APA family
MFTFKTEIEHYSPTITSEGNLVRKDFRILLPYTPENPDRLIQYAIRVAKEKDGKINILRNNKGSSSNSSICRNCLYRFSKKDI